MGSNSVIIIILISCIAIVISQNITDEESDTILMDSQYSIHTDSTTDRHKSNSFKGFLNGNYYKPFVVTFFMFALYLIIASLIKVGFHKSPFLVNNIPESCILIIIGIWFGTLFKIFGIQEFPKFSVNLFLYGLMPPIIMEAAHSLHNEVFFSNVITILMYAVVGTLINVLLIGMFLYIFVIINIDFLNFPQISLIEVLIFSNAISAVDPVTVLNIFQELNVNKNLYYLVFGESLLNDAVVIVLQELLTNFVNTPIITTADIIEGVGAFFYVSVGGFLIGIIYGIFTSIMTLYTKHSEVVEPTIMLGMAYLAFLTADVFHLSGLISLIGCGLTQSEFANRNTTEKTNTTVKYSIKGLSTIADLLIFFFLGQMLISMDHIWNTSFVVFTIIFCLIFRIVSVFSLTYFSNRYFHRTRIVQFKEQILMAYGGLRGAIAFAMIALLSEVKGVKNVDLFKTTTFVLILFTVFILGGTTKPLLKLLNIQTEINQKKRVFFIINDMVVFNVINGVEQFVGNLSTVHYIRQQLRYLINCLKKYISKSGVDHMEAKILKMKNKNIEGNSNDNNKGNKSTNKESSAGSNKLLQTLNKIHTEINAESDYNDILSQSMANNVVHVDEVTRSHNIPHQMTEKAMTAKSQFKSDNNCSHFRDQINTNSIVQQFKKPDSHKNLPQNDDKT